MGTPLRKCHTFSSEICHSESHKKQQQNKKGILFLLKKKLLAELDISGLPNAERMATTKWAFQNAKI